MAGPNIDVIYSKVGDVSSNAATAMAPTLVTATGDYTGVSANHAQVFLADSTNGGFIQRLHFQAIGSNTASVARIYINNGSTHTTATNNSFYGQCSLLAVTATNTAATNEQDYPMNFALNPGFSLWVGLGTTVASGWVCVAIGGKY